MTKATTPSSTPTPEQQLAIRRHLASAEGAHLLCRRKACRRAKACRQDAECRSALHGDPGAAPVDAELMGLRIAYLISLLDHWARLPAMRAQRRRSARTGKVGRGKARVA